MSEVCCCCKDPAARVTYHNYREQPFCWPCADAKCVHEEPEGDHPNGFLCRRHGVDDCFCSGPPDYEIAYDTPSGYRPPKFRVRSLTPTERAQAMDPDAWAVERCDGSETCTCMDECCRAPQLCGGPFESCYEPSKCAAGLDWHRGRNCSCRPRTDTPQGYANEEKETRVPKIGIDEGMAKFGVAWHVDKSKTFTTVILTGERYVGLGTAKRNPVDTYDRQTGFDIAMSRALHELADQVERGAHA